jgi:hypothetical protein
VVESLFPDPANKTVIDEYLSDGIDIDSDGLFFEERSPNYNIVAQWGLLYLVDYWHRRDLLEFVARSLRHCLRMRQPNDHAETLFSHRQDRGARQADWGDYYVFKRMAIETRDGEFAWAADRLRDKMAANGRFREQLVPLRYAFDDPRFADDEIPRSEPAQSIRYRYADHPIWRYREGQVAATVVADPGGHYFDITQGTWGGKVRSDAFMSYHHANAIIDAVKLRWGSGTGGFRPEKIEYGQDGLVLMYADPGWQHVSHFRPREKWGPRLIEANQNATVRIAFDAVGVFTLHIRIGGWPDMPVNIQLLLREDNRLEMPDGIMAAPSYGGQTFTEGEGSYVLSAPDGSGIKITGLPPSDHRMRLGESRIIGGIAEQRCHRLIAGLFTSVDVTVTLTPVTGA